MFLFKRNKFLRKFVFALFSPRAILSNCLILDSFSGGRLLCKSSSSFSLSGKADVVVDNRLRGTLVGIVDEPYFRFGPLQPTKLSI
jgi:hypothetical protein